MLCPWDNTFVESPVLDDQTYSLDNDNTFVESPVLDDDCPFVL